MTEIDKESYHENLHCKIMDDTNKLVSRRNKVVYFLTLVIILLGIYLVWYINTQSYACLSNPYSYPIKLLEKTNNATVTCSCTAVNSNPVTAFFIINRDGIKVNPLNQTNSLLYNFTKANR